ncbi:MAG TPA: hypothetical protein DF637_08275 [Rikenellaceae bacterium]|nr:hypothetical protein [Rikenellaceae bacterium]
MRIIRKIDFIKLLSLVIILAPALMISSCSKDDTLFDELKGTWSVRDFYTTVTATKDFSFLDMNSPQGWSGEVLENNVPVENCVNRYYDNLSPYIAINKDIILSLGNKRLIYKNSQFDVVLNSEEAINNGKLQVEFNFMYGTNPVNLKINLEAPLKEVMTGNTLTIYGSKESLAGVPLSELKFMSPTEVRGKLTLNNILDNFSGTWSVNLDIISLNIKSTAGQVQYMQNYKFLLTESDLILSTESVYPQSRIFTYIPNENITNVIHHAKYSR